ncbi:phosphatidylserine decarboxylase proenzyme, mitochondrial isoform X2 [Condylostylus longicornis]|uniref:phosphatidylserine decarboxylase proenzyme, mitochondrial isoform X2 n=1 Tax=Condylostylus longicornis TaxID=2530218 RepID=UPI00244E4535|nr:phosphatidylserine decarboxylase proenzyme, mitochondrial isoform X2 [Condylostylus longicornis]
MSFYILQKSQFLTKASQLKKPQCQSKWSIKWTFRKTLLGNSNKNSLDSTISVQANVTRSFSSSNQGGLPNGNQGHLSNSSGANTGTTTSSTSGKKGGWFTWSGLLMRWTPIGVTLFAVLEWHFHNQRLKKEGLPYIASPFQANVYCSLPLRMVSRCWGWLADRNVPVSLRPYVYGLYSKKFDVQIEEAENPELKDYRSLSQFFTRSLKEGVRVIDSQSNLVSPADGRVLHFGSASNSQIEQVKGVTYRIESFLGPDNWMENGTDTNSYLTNIKHDKSDKTSLYQCVIYLAPGDYHRFHSPTEWEPTLRRHFHGELLSVNPKIAQWLPGLFCLNERATYIGKWKYGFFSFTAVGATNVGSVQIYFDEDLKTNKYLGIKPGHLKTKTYDEIKILNAIKLNKGDIVGQFNMGSTIVLIFEAPNNFKFNLQSGQKILVGQSLGSIVQE